MGQAFAEVTPVGRAWQKRRLRTRKAARINARRTSPLTRAQSITTSRVRQALGYEWVDVTGGYALALPIAATMALLAPGLLWVVAPRRPNPPPADF
jgi:hypothetical protein